MNYWAEQTGVYRQPTHVPILLDYIEKGLIDPSFIITHTVAVDEALEMYLILGEKEDDCIKVVMKPFAALRSAQCRPF